MTPRLSVNINKLATLRNARGGNLPDIIKSAKDCERFGAQAITPYIVAARYADSIGLGINAGHDLNLDNLAFFRKNIPALAEVSIGHALICDAIYFGLENTIQLYRRQLIA